MRNKTYFLTACCFLTAFLLWTITVTFVDVQNIGPEDSAVGFAGLNGTFHRLTGVHMGLYTLTDRLSLIPVLFILGFGLLGLFQWIRRKSLKKVDHSILTLGGFYLLTGAAYAFFEKCIINYRPVLMEGVLEASYPSSTTMLVICVMSTAAMQLRQRIRHPGIRKAAVAGIFLFSAFMVIGRLLSGVHWLTDILGGILISTGLVLLYAGFTQKRDC